MPEGADFPTRKVSSRRRYERMPLQACTVEIFRFVFFGMREKALPHKVSGIDLSEVGMRLALPERLNVGERLRLVATLDLFKDTIEGECTVVWSAPSGRSDTEFLAGVEWTVLAPGHFAKIQQIRRTMRSKEFQQMLQTKNRMKKEKPDDLGQDGLEYKPPANY